METKLVRILVFGKNADILATVLRLLNATPGWSACGATEAADAEALFQQEHFDLVMLGGGVEDVTAHALEKSFKKINPRVKIVQHYGGGSGLLFNEVRQALDDSTTHQAVDMEQRK